MTQATRATLEAIAKRHLNLGTLDTRSSDDVAYSPDEATADAIAEGLWEYGTNDDHDDLDRDATIASLARTLRYEGGAA